MAQPKSPLYIFLHLPKTGGITLRYHIIKRFGQKRVLFFNQSKDEKFATIQGVNEFLSCLSDKEKNGIKIIFGHEVYYGIHRHFPNREPCYITFFREPTKLYVSFYNFFKNKIDEGSQFVTRERTDFVPADVDLTFSNFVKYSPNLSYGYFENRLLAGKADFKVNRGQANFPQIKKILASFFFIGLTENPADFLFVYNLLGVRKFYCHKNVTKKFLVDEKRLNRQELAAATELDQELYRYAKELNRHLADSLLYQKLVRRRPRQEISKIIFYIPDLVSNLAYGLWAKGGATYRQGLLASQRVNGLETRSVSSRVKAEYHTDGKRYKKS